MAVLVVLHNARCELPLTRVAYPLKSYLSYRLPTQPSRVLPG